MEQTADNERRPLLGVNVPGRGEVSAAAIADFGAGWVRCVVYPDTDISDWIRACHRLGIKVLLVLAHESLDSSWDRWITVYRDRYGPLVDAWQVGNESDHDSPSSWTLNPRGLNLLLGLAREQLGPDALLVGPGLVSGNASYADQIDWSKVDALAVHPYGQRPEPAAANWELLPGNFGFVGELLDRYRHHGRPIWVTEFGVSTDQVSEAFQARYLAAMTTALLGQDLVPVAMPFCWDDRMVPRFGLLDSQDNRKESYRAVHAAALAVGAALPPPPTTPPQEPTALFQAGFAKWAELEPALLGQPLKPERGFAPGVSLQPTTTGRLYWVDKRARQAKRYGPEVDLDEVYGFDGNDGTQRAWRAGWPASRVVPPP